MERGRVLNLKWCGAPLQIIKRNYILIILVSFFLAGLCFGNFSIHSSSPVSSFLAWYANRFFEVRAGKVFLTVLMDSFFGAFLFWLMCFVFGTSVSGIVFIPAFMFIKGSLSGYLSALVYTQYSFRGIILHTVSILPVGLIQAVAVIYAAKISLDFCTKVIIQTLPDKQARNLSEPFKAYFIRLMLILIVFLISSLADGWLSSRFISSFSIS